MEGNLTNIEPDEPSSGTTMTHEEWSQLNANNHADALVSRNRELLNEMLIEIKQMAKDEKVEDPEEAKKYWRRAFITSAISGAALEDWRNYNSEIVAETVSSRALDIATHLIEKLFPKEK
jgi:hypothetical protein